MISVDTKKKELVGDFKNAGREWRPKGEPELVRVHDFKDKQLGKAIPYGVYDLGTDEGWVNVGIDHDTAQFAVNSIRSWWEHLGQPRYPNATPLQITADCGGSNGNRTKLWKVELQKLADETGLEIAVCHFPPGTSKWNRIEHRLFSFITMNWRGKPLDLAGDDHQPDRRDQDQHRPRGLRPARRRHLPRQDQGHRHRTQRRQPPRRRVPSRMELHHQTETLIIYKPLVRAAAFAASVSASVSHLGPGRVRPERRRPADSSCPGQIPAQDAKCADGRESGSCQGRTRRSAPARSAVATPGIVHNSSTICACGASIASILLVQRGDRLIERVDVREQLRDQDPVMVDLEAVRERLAELRDLRAQPGLRQLGQLAEGQ